MNAFLKQRILRLEGRANADSKDRPKCAVVEARYGESEDMASRRWHRENPGVRPEILVVIRHFSK
jgi:hypothetical protein